MKYRKFAILIPIFMAILFSNFNNIVNARIFISDPHLKVQLVVDGLNRPTTMAFVDSNNILVLEKDGEIQTVTQNHIARYPVLNISSEVDSRRERGLLGIAVSGIENGNENIGSKDKSINIYLYFTAKINNSRVDTGGCLSEADKTTDVSVNRLYRYKFENGQLVNPKLLLSIPIGKCDLGLEHIGGAITLGPDNKIYIPTGDGRACRNYEDCKISIARGNLDSQTANNRNGSKPSGSGGILYVTQDGQPPNKKGILGGYYPLNLYYAYGIRNSFGLDFDPITGYLWDTENGPFFGDEINLVKPGFNSGWAKAQGIWPIENYSQLANNPPPSMSKGYYLFPTSKLENQTMFNFHGNGKYSEPEFTWNITIVPTGLKFLNSDKLGKEYKNDIFVGSLSGYLYHFDLGVNRDRLLLKGQLKDRVAGNNNELRNAIFAGGLKGITDLDVGPDGFLYILSISEGKIWRIVPSDTRK